ncbi:toll/interleukin-1 receptor domain-containing protein [Methylocucumis oryzae]|uniref:toll/interleukin-1 receptor domain-containing protein n=1 Tax=Methylocucumis oryzae TaxID=1632867 RepID=UPI0019554091|nr:toll/interleukin-1 receptor domain-containing protein [Methylocucumis oryzae]
MLKPIKEILEKNKVNWIGENKGIWWINIEKLYEFIPNLHRIDWLHGVVNSTVEIEYETRKVFDKEREETLIQLIVTKEEMERSLPKKIFLSHKGVDKPLVRKYSQLLSNLGFEPWLDEDAMVAGVPLERAILQGMKNSCAAIFFVTSNYEDENFLASEVNYAISEKREKKERFSIITLVMRNKTDSTKVTVPDLLKQYVWKEPEDDIMAINEIIRALPIRLINIEWKEI